MNITLSLLFLVASTITMQGMEETKHAGPAAAGKRKRARASFEAVEAALHYGRGQVQLFGAADHAPCGDFSRGLHSPRTGRTFRPASPARFSIPPWEPARAARAPTIIFLGLIVFQPDLGTAIACAGITACILFVAGIRLRYFGYAFAASILPLYFLIFHVSYRRDRILTFLHPGTDPLGRGFNILQSLIAVSTGGITGQGLMEGKQKLFYLPEPHTDFIFAVTAEELGLVGALAVIILFAIFLWRGTRAALRTQDNFGRFLAVGITSMIVLQAFINISVVLGLMPTKGIPLPLVSYGGSSLFVTLACVGVLLNITKQAE